VYVCAIESAGELAVNGRLMVRGECEMFSGYLQGYGWTRLWVVGQHGLGWQHHGGWQGRCESLGGAAKAVCAFPKGRMRLDMGNSPCEGPDAVCQGGQARAC